VGGLETMVLGLWYWAYGFGRMVWAWVNSLFCMAVGVWLGAYGFVSTVLGIWL